MVKTSETKELTKTLRIEDNIRKETKKERKEKNDPTNRKGKRKTQGIAKRPKEKKVQAEQEQ